MPKKSDRYVITIVVTSPDPHHVHDYVSDLESDLRCVDNIEPVSFSVEPENS